MNAPQCTPKLARNLPARPRSSAGPPRYAAFELRVPLDKTFSCRVGEAHGYTAVFVVAFDANNGSDAEARMTNFAPQHGLASPPRFRSGAREGTFEPGAGAEPPGLASVRRAHGAEILPANRNIPGRARSAESRQFPPLIREPCPPARLGISARKRDGREARNCCSLPKMRRYTARVSVSDCRARVIPT